MMIISTGGVLPSPDGPPVRHVSHYGDAPSPAVCQVFLPTYYFTFDFNFRFDFHFTFHSLCRRAASTTRPRCCRRATTSPPPPSTTTATSSPPPTTTTRSALNLHIYLSYWSPCWSSWSSHPPTTTTRSVLNLHTYLMSHNNDPQVISSTLEAYPSLPPMEPSPSSHYRCIPHYTPITSATPESSSVMVKICSYIILAELQK